jgi:hypothetical protein
MQMCLRLLSCRKSLPHDLFLINRLTLVGSTARSFARSHCRQEAVRHNSAQQVDPCKNGVVGVMAMNIPGIFCTNQHKLFAVGWQPGCITSMMPLLICVEHNACAQLQHQASLRLQWTQQTSTAT